MSELIDRQALKDYVSSLSTHPLNEWDTWGVLAAIDKQPTIAASPWHRVEEPPKEEHRTYLVYTDTGYMCSCRWTNNVYGLGESDRWGWSIADVPQFQNVTHWMPIEPPKEVTNE